MNDNEKFQSEQPIELQKDDNKIALLAQADLLLLITQMFAQPSTDIKEMLAGTDIEELLHYSSLPAPNKIAEIYQQICQQAQITSLETWAGEYNRLFEASVVCPINESGFIRRDKGVILADIAGFYCAFGFELSQNASEKVDHLIGELEFVAMLLVMLANAETLEATRNTHNALASFCFDHLGEWLPVFCERLTETTTLPFYQHQAKLLLNVWEGIVTVNHLPVPEESIKTSHEEEGTPYECGMVDDS